MAARTRKIFHDEETRLRIKCSQLLNRLEDHAFGVIELSQGQIASIKILLGKALPDLQSISIEGNSDGDPIKVDLNVAELIITDTKDPSPDAPLGETPPITKTV